VVIPDPERIVGGVDSKVTALRNEMLSHFDALEVGFDRHESEASRIALQHSKCG